MTIDMNEISPSKNKKTTGWIIGCSTVFIITLCLVLFFVLGGVNWAKSLFASETPKLSVGGSISSQSVSVGETFTIEITVENVGKKNVTINSIRMPGELLNIATVEDIHPNDLTQQDDQNPRVYHLDLLIAPTGKQSFTYTFEAIKAGVITKDIELVNGEIITPIGINVTVSPEVVFEDTPEPILGDVIPYQSVVQIIAMVEVEGEQKKGWSGSGTIISEDGLILTNAHVVLSDRYYVVEELLVLITQQQDQPPVPMFYADILQADAYKDLAVIKIKTDLNGNPADLSTLGIEPVPLGDSASLELGDELIIIGYPGIGGETITLTRGEVSGFTSQEEYGSRAFIKTSATIAGGNSGGLAATAQGEIIGVPTKVGYGTAQLDYVDCRPLADTNRDGKIDENDNCVPTGGFINALRPLDLALPLIEAAKAGQVTIIEKTPPPQQEQPDPGGDIILLEEFNDNSNNWYLDEYNEAAVAISGGHLVMDVYTENTYVYSELMQNNYESIIIGVDIDIINPAYDGDIGLICGYQDENNFTALEITEDGFYTIWAYSNSQYNALIEWTKSDIIPENGPYTLSAYCGPDRLAFGVNGTLLVESNNPDYRAGYVGLIAGTYENPNISVGFDNFMIIQP